MMIRRIIFIVIIGIFLMFAGNVVAHGDEEDSEESNIWIGHAVLGFISLLLGGIIAFAGGALKGRFRKPKFNINKVHTIFTRLFLITVIVTFLYGLWVTYEHGEEVFKSLHSYVGAVLVISSGLSFILSPCITKKVRKTKIHTIMALIVFISLLTQIILGILNVI